MSRRNFIKWLFAYIVLSFGVIFSFFTGKNLIGPWVTAAEDPADAQEETPPIQSTPKPEGSGELLLSFFLFSDMHILNGDSITADRLKLALNDVKNFESDVEAIVFGGDLTDLGRDTDYKLLKRILDGYKLPPLYANMGNHDYYDIWMNKDDAFVTETMPNGKTDAQARQRFQKFINYKKTPYQDVWLKGVHLIMVSQEAYAQERADVGEGAWYSDEQLDWLKGKLEDHKDGRPALVMIHQPLPTIGTDGRTHQMIRAKEFREILKPYPNVFVFSGHTHRDLNEDNHYSKETFHWFINSSVGRTRRSNGQQSKLAQGMYIQVYENEVLVKGREFTDRSWIANADWRLPLETIES
jgi:Icc protein